MTTRFGLEALAERQGLTFRALTVEERRERKTTASHALFDGAKVWRGYSFPDTEAGRAAFENRCIALVIEDLALRAGGAP